MSARTATFDTHCGNCHESLNGCECPRCGPIWTETGAAIKRRRPWETQATHRSGERYWIRSWGRLACRIVRGHKDRPTIKGVRTDTGEPIHGHQCLRCWRGVKNGSSSEGQQ